ncbi:glucose-6-phosphate dehydrogenase assembly protein OpcA [Corynebacterium halotolerans]|uniref:glucose-6-phosphate dehydrogenase assembly protein OpcA n=1 Tax=Corynebacterium halotolerans TaxID=225326 RepID=UPI003CE96821
MIIDLPDTTTRKISAALLESKEAFSQATGRVLTLIVVASQDDDVDAIIAATEGAAHEHPARVLVMLAGPKEGPALLDAQIRVAGEAGAAEMVLMRISGELSQHLESVVTPLLLPDTPIVAWWPYAAPADPSEHPIGRLSQRRITDALYDTRSFVLSARRENYTPGDSDLMWSRITQWRGIVASSLEQCPGKQITAARVHGPIDHPSVDIAAGWLADRLGVEIVRSTGGSTHELEQGMFMISSLELEQQDGTVEISVVDSRTIRVSVPGLPDSLVALSRRSIAECLAEELRHLDPDIAYAHALRGLGQLTRR